MIPTYERAALLRGTLDALAGQRLPTAEFEVVVSDDGSHDDTREVVAGFADRLSIRYRFQEDLGFRAAAARNAGARLASAPVLAFVDAGILPGPDFLAAHLAAHLAVPEGAAQDPPRAVIGYTFGYRPGSPTPGLGDAVRVMTPEELVGHYGDAPDFRDARHLAFARFGFDLGRSAVPWQWFWSMNCSVRADDFLALGGFDESFRSWGGEDLELGFRLFRHGVRPVVSRDAWAVDVPHPRAASADLASNHANFLAFLHKHPEPVVELLWAWFARERPGFEVRHDWNTEDEYLLLLDAAAAAGSVDVTRELAPLRDVAPGTRIAVLGCGASIPPWLPRAELFDFDRHAVNAAARSGRSVRHAIGLRTTLPDDSFDIVLVTSRLKDLWSRWRPQLLAEARRIGGDLRGPLSG
ncbi:Chondroitin polymerase [Streptomyces sp. MP131-18]|nr:Chondroitin polymerase [Streptomyces sp. MP131-18]